jgi:signal peptidase I
LLKVNGGNGNGGTPKLLSGSVKIPAGQATPSVLRILFPRGTPSPVILNLSRGSFHPESRLQQKTFELDDGIAEVTVHPTNRPTSGWLTGHGLRLKLGFVPVKLAHIVLWEWLPIAIGALCATLLLRTFAFASFFIPSSSMEQTIDVGDLVLSWNFSYQVLGEDPQRGDIIVFDHPNPTHEMWIKRVIGEPGDVIESYGGQVIVNGKVLKEPYVKQPSYFDFGPVRVPNGFYFVMGDNRRDSMDSRFWGPLHRDRIVGRAAFVFWPWSNARVVLND